MAKKNTEIEKLGLKTKDQTKENIKKISNLFPEVITEVKKEGKIIKIINEDRLKELIGEFTTDDEEIYSLNWVGKRNSKRKIAEPLTKTLRPIIKDSVDFENTKNLYIEGDNFDVLKLLKESYLNSIKMIYIDPPYNTGRDFVYKDNFTMSKEEYDEESGAIDEEGNKLFKNTTTNGRFHSDWLSMMYERLKIAYDLLKDDGLIFISIDDNEVTNLRKVCDEVFGEGNFVNVFIWLNNSAGRQIQGSGAATTKEYVLCYSKDIAQINEFLIEVEYAKNLMPDIYKGFNFETKEDSLGKYIITHELNNGNSMFNEKTRPNLIFDIFYNPKTTEVKTGEVNSGLPKDFVRISPKKIFDGTNKYYAWRWSKDKIKNETIDLDFIKTKDNWAVFTKRRDYDKTTLKDMITNITTLKGSNDLAKLELANFFDYPKPIDLIKLFTRVATNKSSLILDFFSGSATTAQAVMQLNSEDGGDRKFIMVQLPEETDEESEAFKAGYKNICEIGKERIRRAGKNIKEELKEKSKQQKLDKTDVNISKLDLGFKVFKIDSSNMKDVYYNPNEIDQRTLTNFKDNIKDDRTSEDLLYQVLLLDMPIENCLAQKVRNEKIKNKKVFVVETDSGENWLVACFEEGVNQEFIKEIVELKPLRIVFRDSSFKNDSDKVNCEEYLKHKLPNTQMRVI